MWKLRLKNEYWHLFLQTCLSFSLSIELEEEVLPFLLLSIRNQKNRRRTAIFLAQQPKFEVCLGFGSLFHLGYLFSFHLGAPLCFNVQKCELFFLQAEEYRSTSYQKKKQDDDPGPIFVTMV